MELRNFHPGEDEALLIALRAAVWGDEHPHNSAAFFQWLFRDNPDGEGGGVLLEEGGQAVGFAGLATRQMLSDGEVISVAMGLDYMIHPDFRNGFAASRLVNGWLKNVSADQREYAFGLCYPNTNSYKILTGKKLAWQPVCELTMMIRPIGKINKLPGKLARLPSWLLGPAFRAASLFSTLIAGVFAGRDTPGALEEISHFDERFDALWARAQIRTGSARTAAHLNWRYLRHPLYKYRSFAWVRDGKVLGYVIVTVREVFDIPAVLIVDALGDPSEPNVLATLVKRVANYTRDHQHALIAAQVVGHSALQKAFTKAGLLSVPKRLCPKSFALTFHTLGRGAHRPQIEQWHLTWGDMDVV